MWAEYFGILFLFLLCFSLFIQIVQLPNKYTFWTSVFDATGISLLLLLLLFILLFILAEYGDNTTIMTDELEKLFTEKLCKFDVVCLDGVSLIYFDIKYY